MRFDQSSLIFAMATLSPDCNPVSVEKTVNTAKACSSPRRRSSRLKSPRTSAVKPVTDLEFQKTDLDFQRAKVQQLLREASIKRINVSEAINDIKVCKTGLKKAQEILKKCIFFAKPVF